MIDIPRLLKRAHVGAQSEKTDGLQETMRTSFILNEQATLFEQFYLGGDINGRFVERSHAQKTPGIKTPHNLCLVTCATRGMAGVLRQRLGSSGNVCKLFEQEATDANRGFGIPFGRPGSVREAAIFHATLKTVLAHLLLEICGFDRRDYRREWYRLTLRNSHGSARSGSVRASRIPRS